jgi:hypothetical protein
MAGLNPENNLLPQCLICGTTPETGICGGIRLRKRFLCNDCQDRILAASIDDPFYTQMKEGLKDLWCSPVRTAAAAKGRVGSEH